MALPPWMRASGSRHTFRPVDHADRGEEQQRRMRVGDEDMGDEVLSRVAMPARPLPPVLTR